MLARRDKSVRVTRPEALDAALRNADRVIVEGDAALTAWAIARVLGEAIPTAGAGLHGVAAEDRAAHVAVGRAPNPLWPWIGGALVLAALVGAAFLLEHFSLRPAAMRSELARPRGGAAAGTDWVPLAWAGVAVVVALLGFLLARRALDSGRDVTVAWKISEQVQGRVEFVRRAA